MIATVARHLTMLSVQGSNGAASAGGVVPFLFPVPVTLCQQNQPLSHAKSGTHEGPVPTRGHGYKYGRLSARRVLLWLCRLGRLSLV